MKLTKLFICLFIASSFLMFTACGGGGGGSGSSGEVSMDITDAKPVLPEGATNLWITFTEVLAHKSGGGWMSLPLPESPYTIDLLQFYDGNTTELVPPVSLESGKYTQIRIVVSEATIRFNDDPATDEAVEIPSENLKTDKNFTFVVEGGGAVDITVDFDLSQSLVVTDESGTPSYKLKPVLHIVDTFEAATINGKIAYDSFVDGQEAIVTVSVCTDNTFLSCETYTQLKISRYETLENNPTEFRIFWLVPDEYYRVEIDFAPPSGSDYTEKIEANNPDIGPSEIYTLNGGDPI